jgi:hypothetical protein
MKIYRPMILLVFSHGCGTWDIRGKNIMFLLDVADTSELTSGG